MSPNQKFDNILNKAKSLSKQTADNVGRQAKKVKLQAQIMTLDGEKKRHLNTIGTRCYSLFTETNTIDGKTLLDRIRDEIAQIERIESRVREIESEIADLSASTQHVDVEDVTAKE